MTWGMRVQLSGLPPGEGATAATIAAMAQFVLSPQEGGRDPRVVEFARAIVRDLDSKDYEGELRRIFEYVKGTVRYVQDPRGLEYVATPYRTLFVTGNGDCDDHAVVVGALALALNHGVRFRTVKVDPRRPRDWSHVYAMVGCATAAGPVRWFALDTSQPQSYFDWEPPGILEARDWEVAAA